MNSLRVLNGDKEGASLSLTPGRLTIGSLFDSTLMLSSLEIADSVLEIQTLSDGTVAIASVSGPVLWSCGEKVEPGDEWSLEEPVKFGQVWLAIAESSSKWLEELPSDPREEFTEHSDTASQSMADEEIKTELEALSESFCGQERVVAKKIASGKMSTGLKVFSVIAISMGVISLTHSVKAIEQKTKNNVNSDVNIVSRDDRKINTDLTLIKKMIAKREIPNIQLYAAGDVIRMEGKVSKVDAGTLDRMMVRIKRYHPNVLIKNDTTLMGSSLPFNIVSVVTGSKPRVYLENHGLVSVGKEILGYRLDSITNTTITFSGEESITINW